MKVLSMNIFFLATPVGTATLGDKPYYNIISIYTGTTQVNSAFGTC